MTILPFQVHPCNQICDVSGLNILLLFFSVTFHANLFRTYGPPKSVQNDGGGEFLDSVKDFLERIGIERRPSRPYHPQSQGKVERSHGTWKEKVKFDLLREARNGKSQHLIRID